MNATEAAIKLLKYIEDLATISVQQEERIKWLEQRVTEDRNRIEQLERKLASDGK